MSRGRISIALRDGDHRDLAQLAASRQMPSARLAGELVAEGLDRVRERNALARAAGATRATPADLAGLDMDIHQALCTPGVVRALTDPDAPADSRALRALIYLVDVSAWLSDPRPYMDRARPPRLFDPVTSHQHRGPIAPALARAGGADERARLSREAEGLSSMSDKRQLSDMPSAGAVDRPEDDDEPV
jgi:hypothetical protein